MKTPRVPLLRRPALALGLAMLCAGSTACSPEEGGQSGSELSCQNTQECVDNLGDGFACGVDKSCAPAIDICPDLDNPDCPGQLACEVDNLEPNERNVVAASCTGTEPDDPASPWLFDCDCTTEGGGGFPCNTYVSGNPCVQGVLCCTVPTDTGN